MPTTLLLALLAAAPDAPSPDGLEARLAGLFKKTGLTADDAARAAAATSREVEAKAAARDGAQASLDAARLGYVPRVTAGAGYTRLSPITAPAFGGGDSGRFVVTEGPAGPVGTRPLFAAPDFAFPVFLDNGQLRAGVAIPVSDYLWRGVQQVLAAEHSRAAAGLDEQAARLGAAAGARIAYYQWVRGRGQRLVAEQALEQSARRDQDVHHAFEVGASSRADVLRFDALVEAAKLLVARADNAALLAEDALATAMHLEPGAPLEIGEDIFAELPPLERAGDFEALLREAQGQRVELAVLGEGVAALESQRRGLWANVLPRLDLTGNLLYANPNPRYIPGEQVWHFTWDVGVGLSWAPSDLPAAVAQVGAADARVRQAVAQRKALLDALRLEVRQAWLSLRESDVALGSTLKALLAAEESYRVRQDLFRNGRATVVEVIDAETERTRARLEAINARIDLRIARVRLERATGRDAGK